MGADSGDKRCPAQRGARDVLRKRGKNKGIKELGAWQKRVFPRFSSRPFFPWATIGGRKRPRERSRKEDEGGPPRRGTAGPSGAAPFSRPGAARSLGDQAGARQRRAFPRARPARAPCVDRRGPPWALEGVPFASLPARRTPRARRDARPNRGPAARPLGLPGQPVLRVSVSPLRLDRQREKDGGRGPIFFF